MGEDQLAEFCRGCKRWPALCPLLLSGVTRCEQSPHGLQNRATLRPPLREPSACILHLNRQVTSRGSAAVAFSSWLIMPAPVQVWSLSFWVEARSQRVRWANAGGWELQEWWCARRSFHQGHQILGAPAMMTSRCTDYAVFFGRAAWCPLRCPVHSISAWCCYADL